MLAEIAHWLVAEMMKSDSDCTLPVDWKDRVEMILKHSDKNWSHLSGRLWVQPLIESVDCTDKIDRRALYLAVEASARIGASMLFKSPADIQVAASIVLYLVYESLVEKPDAAALESKLTMALENAPTFDIQHPLVVAHTIYSFVQQCMQNVAVVVQWSVNDLLTNARHSLGDVWFWDTVQYTEAFGPRLALTTIQSVQEILDRHIKAASKRLRWQQIDQIIIEGPNCLWDHAKEIRYLIAAYSLTHEWSQEIYDADWIQQNIEALRAVMGRVSIRKTDEHTVDMWSSIVSSVPNLFAGLTRSHLMETIDIPVLRWPLRDRAYGDLIGVLENVRCVGPHFAPNVFQSSEILVPVSVRLMTTRGGAWPERRSRVEWFVPQSEI